MKIVVATDTPHLEQARKVHDRLAACGLPVCGLRFGARWRDEKGTGVRARLDRCTHVVFVIDTAAVDQQWFAFMVGVSRGKPLKASVLWAGTMPQPVAWISDLRFFVDLGEVASYLLAEQADLAESEARQLAKAELLERGVSWHADSMAQCVRDGDAESVRLFIDSGFPPIIRDKAGVPMLCLAARSKHRTIAELLLERGASLDEQSDDRGYSALMEAAKNGELSLLEFLLERGADPNLTSKDGQTALALAVGRNDAPMVAALMAAGADPDLEDKLGFSARKYAGLFKNAGVLAALGAPS